MKLALELKHSNKDIMTGGIVPCLDKFNAKCIQVNNNVDILLVFETKLNYTFPSGQFLIEGYAKPIRLDRNCYAGLLFLYTITSLAGNYQRINFQII